MAAKRLPLCPVCDRGTPTIREAAERFELSVLDTVDQLDRYRWAYRVPIADQAIDDQPIVPPAIILGWRVKLVEVVTHYCSPISFTCGPIAAR